MDENKINPSISDGQKTDVLLVHDKRAGTVNVVKGVDTDGSLQTVPPTQKHASEFMRVDNNSDPFTNFFSNFYRKINDTEGLGFFRCNASAVEQNAEAIRQGNKQGEMLRVPKPDFHEFPKNQYRIDPAKIDWDSLKKIGITEEMLKKTKRRVQYIIANEAGASVYSASKLGAEEFPDYDVSLRSAVSIGRRIQDPLAELVKIDPKSIGVGQYQHDMNQKRLGEALGGVVEDCVNSVGVDLNTASPALLSYVAGIHATVAKNILKYREEHGKFTARRELLKVAKLGPKAYEQCAGFLRLPESEMPLDRTGVHPESYAAAEGLLALCGYGLADVAARKVSGLAKKIKSPEKTAAKLGIGVPTLEDIMRELEKPGRDPREDAPAPVLRSDVLSMEDLQEGMVLTGTVRNVIDFGVFVDIGVHQDGLVHISQICDRFIKHPLEAVRLGDVVRVKVLSVDLQKKRIALTMKGI